MQLEGQTILITGAARRVGRAFALSAAREGADILLHHNHSTDDADQTAGEIRAIGRKVWVLRQDLGRNDPESLIENAWKIRPFDALVNSAAIFGSETWETTSREAWQQHLAVNLTAPFFLSQAFARHLGASPGRIINILDWRALRPGSDHFAYTISKAALASPTQAMAVALAPKITVNGLALGAILPPGDSSDEVGILSKVPAGRWATLEEVGSALIYLLSETGYTTGAIIHLDGGRHLV